MHEYGDDFYAFLSSFAVRSAQKIVPLVLKATGARSVADFGCGQGAWLSVWEKAGLEVTGLDGPYVNQSKLLVDPANFRPTDLATPINLGRRFDIVQSLETAEHLPASRAAGFVADLTSHADFVLFSAAVPGQGGEHHINEQGLEYWRRLFDARGFAPVDLVRPALRGDEGVQLWYRCNTVLYVRRERLDQLPAAGQTLAEYWPLASRIRQSFIRLLPVPAVDFLARVNARRYAPT